MINTLYTSILIAYDSSNQPVATSSSRSAARKPLSLRPFKSMQKALRLAFSSVLG